MKQDTIKTIIDTYLNEWVELELNSLPQEIEPEMSDPEQDPKEEWKTWFPVPGKVTDQEIADFEEQIGHQLPQDYKILLKHKHYYELAIYEATFAAHPVNRWRHFHASMIFDGYPREFLIDKGLLPIASWSDWGLLCFDTNRNKEDANYPVVLWDHEQAHHFKDFAPDFYQLLLHLDSEAKKKEEDTVS